MPHEWQYTLAKPVSVRSSRAEAGRARADAHAAMRDSAAVLGSLSYQSSADLRTGWKGKKVCRRDHLRPCSGQIAAAASCHACIEQRIHNYTLAISLLNGARPV